MALVGLFFVFDALLTHPYSTPAKIARLEPSALPTNTVKYTSLGD